MSTPHATGKQIAKGAAWLMGFRLLDKSIGLISTLILVRLLTPSDFGLVAMAMAVVALLELMGAFGFDSALIQRQDTERKHYDTAWTFNVIFSISIAALLVVVAEPAAEFYREPRLEQMLPVLAIGALVNGFENIGTVVFRKEMNFRMEFIYLFIKRIAVFVVVVTLAFTLRTFWALIFATIAGKIIAVLISYRLHPYRPRLSLAARGDLFHFSKWLFFSNLIQFLHSRSTDFILGRTVGSYGLGIYNLAAEIAAMPSTELIAPINRAVYPAYAQLSKNHDKLVARFLEVYGLICLLAFPIAFGLFCVSDLVVAVLLGPKWIESVHILQILGLSGLVSAIQGNIYVLMNSIGKPKILTMVGAGLMFFWLPSIIYFSLHYGTLGAAYAHFFSSIIGFACVLTVCHRMEIFTARQLLSTLWRPLGGSAGMAIVLTSARLLIDNSSQQLTNLILLPTLIILGGACYIIFIISLWYLSGRPQSAENTLFNFSKKIVFKADLLHKWRKQ